MFLYVINIVSDSCHGNSVTKEIFICQYEYFEQLSLF